MAQDYIVKLQGQDNLSSTIKNVKDELKSTGESATQLDKIQAKFEKIQSSTAPLKRQLRDLQAIMAQMNMDGLTNTDQFTQIAQYAGQIKDAMGDAQQAISKYSSDTANLDAVASAFQGISGGISVATGAMNLFGVESENVQQAILKVQSAMALLNGVQAIANTLNKDSALMLKLRAIGLGTNAAAQTANTVAETANTAATTVNTAASGANAAGKTAQAAATTANTAATNAATTAQLANNAAVLANPYVLAAAAVAALTAGIVIWISSLDDSTDSQIALNAAIDAFNEASDSEMKKCAESINLFNKLKNTYDDSGTKIDEFSKKLINNKEAQKKLGVTVKTVDDVHKLFANNTQAYQRAAIARASAMAAEAAQAAMLGSTLSELSKVYAKLQAGQEVNWRDMRKIVEAAGYSSNKADELMKSAGFRYITDGMGYGNVATTGGDLQKLFEEITKGGAIQKLAEMGEAFQQTFSSINEIDFKGMLKNNFAALPDEVEKSATTAAKKGHEAVKKETKATGNEIKSILNQTDDKIKQVLSSLEGCDAVIQQAQKDMKGLKKNSADYAQNVEKIKKAIYAASVAKLSLIDRSTMSGLAEAKSVVQKIINELPQGSAELTNWQTVMTDINKKMYEFYDAAAANGSLKKQKEVANAIKIIIDDLPEGSDELETWVKRWQEINGEIEKASRDIDNMFKGVEKGSIADLQQQLSDIEKKLQNKNLNIYDRMGLNEKADKLREQIAELTNGETSITIPVQTYFYHGSYEDLKKSYQNAQAVVNRIMEENNMGLLDTKMAKQEIQTLNEELQELGLKPIQIHFETDFEKMVDNIEEGFSTIDSIISTVDSIQSLSNAVKEGADAWEIFKSAVSTVESVLSTVSAVMTTVNTIQQLFNTTKSASAAISATETAASTAAATAEQGKAAVDAESVATTTAATVALKSQEAAYLDMAAAAIFAAHASIPFAGVGIATGLITTMMAAQTAQHAATLAMTAFKDGGIVGGSSFYGDKVIARLNTGEMVLNKKQQANLFNAIDNGMFGSGTTENATISFKLKGSDIYGSLKNFTNIKSKSSSIKGF